MVECSLSHTALPNLHPAVVHFPIALLSVAVLFDLAGLGWRRQMWIDRAAAALYALGAVGAWAAYLAGEEAEEGLEGLPAAAETLIEQHEEWALRALVLFAAVALARLWIAWRARREPEVRRSSALRWVALAAALVGLWLLYETADRGGALVYRHGVAVRAGTDAVQGL